MVYNRLAVPAKVSRLFILL